MTDATHDEQDGADDDAAPGWDAIDGALARLYPGQEPKHYGTLVKWRIGGPDPLDGISVWKRAEPV
ncbi:MAG: suppressor of fused domain protein, partial [Burkholderia sp.]|nr:suppressor of fused domain protein [Burkholderia sp.]